ncbi:MAG: hypothetical protein HeimC3_28930 [Candidatus Heimdallarchaeota archaeon LC_3]|nr:MAG: hypothetical protein HeimC3_28930 [Candidatus Heimdallarchaeota archaeon LC_3]
MNSPIITLTPNDLKNSPNIVESCYYWISLLGLDSVIFKDARDGSIIILVPYIDFPDIFIEFDIFGREMIFYTNTLTQVTPDDDINPFNDFLIDTLNEQSKYPQIRLSIDKQEKLTTKIYMRFRTSFLNMEYVTQLLREAESFLKDIQNFLEKYKLPEVWRITEGEQKIPPRSQLRHDYF